MCALFEVLGPGDDVAAGVEPRVIDPVFERRERRAVGVEAFLLVLELEGGVGGIVVCGWGVCSDGRVEDRRGGDYGLFL